MSLADSHNCLQGPFRQGLYGRQVALTHDGVVLPESGRCMHDGIVMVREGVR